MNGIKIFDKSFFRSIFVRIERFSQEAGSTWALFVISIIEASLFPLSVDVPLIAFSTLAPKKSITLGLIAAAGSFLGGFGGYYAGLALFDSLASPLLHFYGMAQRFDTLLSLYHHHGITTLILSGFTPIPYVSFTYAAGFHHTLDLPTLAIGAIIGRFLRFAPIGLLLHFVGPKAKILVERFFGIVFLAFVLGAAVLLVVWLA